MSLLLERHFRAVTQGEDVICTEEQWRSFMHRLAHHGLLGRASEERLLEELWAEASAGANAFGQHRPAALHIRQLRAMLLRQFSTPLDGEIDQALSQLSLQVTSLANLCSDWDLEGMDEIATRQLLTLTEDLTRSHESHRRAAEAYHKRQEHLLKHQAVLALFWDPIPKGVDLALARTALQYQLDNLELIERRAHSRRLRHFRFAQAKDPSLRGRPLPDRFGHGGVGAASCFLAYEVGDTQKPVEVVAAPFAGLPYAKLSFLRQCYSAHREMALSSYVPHCLGLDDVSSPSEQLYFYEHINARPLSSLLARVELSDTQPLFRYWSREILCALTDLAEQCCHRIAHHITPEHIMISSEGTGVSLGNIQWGPPLEPWSPDALKRHKAFEERLAGDFADIVEAMRSSGGRGGEQEVEVTETLCEQGGLNVRLGARFTVRLAARQPMGSLWHAPVIVSADPGAYHVDGPSALQVQGAVPVSKREAKRHSQREVPMSATERAARLAAEGPPASPTYVAEFHAKEVGRFLMRFSCFRPWDGAPAEPTLTLPVEVHDPGGSPVVEAVIRVCRPSANALTQEQQMEQQRRDLEEQEEEDEEDAEAAEGAREERRLAQASQHRVPRLREVLSHPFFAAPTTEHLEMVIANFDELFASS